MKKFGLFQDNDPHYIPAGSSRYTLNGNLVNDGIQNEESTLNTVFFPNTPATLYIPSPDCIGRIPIDQARTVFFFLDRSNDTTATTIKAEIGIVNENGTYQTIIKFKQSNNPNFTTETRLQGTFKVRYNGDIVIYWTDDNNNPRWLNITNPQIAMDNNRIATGDLDTLLIFPNFLQTNVSAANTSVGGGLVSGSYEVALGYATDQFNYTPFFFFSNPVDVVSSITTSPPTQFDGDAPGTLTGKQINLTIGSADFPIQQDYKYVAVAIKSNINGVSTWYKYGDFPITGNTINVTITNLSDKEVLPEEAVTVNNARYKTAKTINQLDDYLYLANLTAEVDPGLQPYVNNVEVNYVTESTFINPQAREDYRDSAVLFLDKSFMWDETYALYMSFVYTDGTETKAYNIPGRRARLIIEADGTVNSRPIYGDTSSMPNGIKDAGTFEVWENTLITDMFTSGEFNTNVENVIGFDWSPAEETYGISNDEAKYFHAYNTADCQVANTPNMGYHENSDETYPDNENWDIKDASGAVVDTIRGENVRHHKFPHASYSQETITALSTGSGADTYQTQQKLGIALSNIVLPADVAADIYGVKIYYAKRTQTNRTILGQSIMIDEGGFQYHAANYGYKSITHVGGNVRFANIDYGSAIFADRESLFPTCMWNEVNGVAPQDTYASDNTAYPLDMFYNISNENTFSEFISLHNFDQLHFKDDISLATHIKPAYKVTSKYVGYVASNANGTGDTDDIKSDADFEGWLTNDFSTSVVDDSVTKHAQRNSIRRFKNSPVYLPANLQGDSPTGNTVRDWANYASLFDKTSNPRNYFGEEYILCELTNRIGDETTGHINTNGPDRPYPRNDCAYIDLTENGSTGANSYFRGTSDKDATFYLVNLCVFKSSIYQNFDSQDLVSTGQIFKLTTTSPDIYEITDEIYSGDTVINFYGFKGHSEIGGIRVSPALSYCVFKFLHYYICQSVANVNYRYEDGSDTSRIYFPKSPATTVLTLSPVKDNWFGYDQMHNKLNQSRQPEIQAVTLSAETGDFPNRILRSDKNNPESVYDNFLSYATNDYVDYGKNKGEIWLLAVKDNKLYIHTRRSLFITMGREVLKTTNLQAYVGSGDIFEVKPMEVTNIETGFGGIQHQWAGVVTPYGYVFPDNESGKVFAFDDTLKEISAIGQQDFFRTTLGFRIEDFIYENMLLVAAWAVGTSYTTVSVVRYNNKIYRCIAANVGHQPDMYPTEWELITDLSEPILNQDDPIKGVGYHAGYDVKYKRYFLTKRDYMVYHTVGDETTTWPSGQIVKPFNPIMATFTAGYFLYNNRLCYFSTSNSAIDTSTYKSLTATVNSISTTLYYWDDMREFSTLAYSVRPYDYTLTFHLDDPTWGSFMVFQPEIYCPVGNKLFTYNTQSAYRHNSADLATTPFLNLYGTNADFIVEPIINEPKGQVKLLNSISVETKAYVIDNTTPRQLPRNATTPRLVLENFDTIQVYDSYQISKENTLQNTVNQRYIDGYWNINDFRDDTLNNDDPLFVTDGINRLPNTANIDTTKHWSLRKRFVDYWFGARLIYTGAKKFVLLNIFANINKNAR